MIGLKHLPSIDVILKVAQKMYLQTEYRSYEHMSQLVLVCNQLKDWLYFFVIYL